MKKNLIVLLAALLTGGTAFGQAVSDRNVIPVAVNLNQVLRMTITNGGNIEFVFNTIDQYEDGISGAVSAAAIYQTDFTVASSTRWAITYGAEQATFIGTDNPTNTLELDNVGFTIASTGDHGFETDAGTGKGTTDADELWSAPTVGATETAALEGYGVVLVEDNDGTSANAGDDGDNSFSLVWRCGTSEGTETPMNAVSLLEQSVTPDRYVANVIFDLAVDN
jgi:hypothetical protein